MKVYKITLRSRWGEPFIVTISARSLDEAIKMVTLEPDWEFSEYREVKADV